MELCCGTKSISRAFEARGWWTVTVDTDPACEADIRQDARTIGKSWKWHAPQESFHGPWERFFRSRKRAAGAPAKTPRNHVLFVRNSAKVPKTDAHLDKPRPRMGAASNMQENKKRRRQMLSLPQARASPGERPKRPELPKPQGVGPFLHQGAAPDAAGPLRRDRAGGGG